MTLHATAPDTWILLRGLLRESGHWGSFVPRLEAALAPARVLALDAPGCGAWYAQRSPASIAEGVQALRAELLQRGIPPPYYLLALSMGGMLAAYWSQHYPQEVAAQVWINTSMRPFSGLSERLQPRNYGRLAGLLLPSTTAQTRETTLWQLTSRLSDSGVVADWLALHRVHPVSSANALRQLWAAARFRAQPTPPACPTLLLASTQDALVNVACSRAIAAAWKLPLHEHPSAGHDLPLDDGRWVVAQLQRWHKGCGPHPSSHAFVIALKHARHIRQ
ncbi:MAG: alpha/beta hydrolase [Rhodoferax sp.]|nr:alpha/beta hydrolase [Rhodoferax sp.]